MTPPIAQAAPDFSGAAIIKGEFKKLNMADYKGKYVVLFFYPEDFGAVCPTEITALTDAANIFREIGCEIICSSCDSLHSHLTWLNTPRTQCGIGQTDIPLLADRNGRIARAYGVYDEETGSTFRAAFIIDRKQILRQMTINDFPVGRNIDEVLRLVMAFQFTDSHGQVCPANWRPETKTRKPVIPEKPFSDTKK